METSAATISIPFQYFEERNEYRRHAVERQFGNGAVYYISRYADMADPGTEVMATSEPFNVEALSSASLRAFVNLKRVNDIDKPNEFFSLVNQKLPNGGYYIGCVETIASRKRRILNKHHPVISYPYYFLDFIIKRVFPKLKPTRRIYSILTRGVNRTMSITETFGRLVACGFEVVDKEEIGYMTYFVCRKKQSPLYNGDASYGFIVGFKRIGKDGRVFKVYKLRTMHPYAEFLQDYVHQCYKLKEDGKFNHDFRITSWGRVLRRCWLDEQPMWINWLRGEMKLVGVRPLSQHYFNLYPEDFRKRRIQYKPGLFPPFYADLPRTFDEIIESERKYLDAYDRRPHRTDIRYVCVALFNIIFKRARSS